MANIDQHFDEEAAEKYSLGTMSARAKAQIEEHLLICETCRQAVAVADEYAAAMRQAAESLRKAQRKPKRTVAGRAGGNR